MATADKVIEHTFTRRKEHLQREVPAEELAQLNGLLTTERKPGDPRPQARHVKSTPAVSCAADDELEELRARYAETTGVALNCMIVEREVYGKKRYIKRLLWPDLAVIGDQIRTESKLKPDKKPLAVMTAVVLANTVVTGPKDATPYFTLESAWAYLDDPAAAEMVLLLFDVVTDINPAALPKSTGASRPSSATRKGNRSRAK